MKRIGILGGSFDPIHKGHIKLASQALIENNLDFVFIMPAKRNPFKANVKMAGDEHRLNMIKLAIKDKPFLCLLENEIKGEDLSYTYDTMVQLKEEFVDCQLYFIVGLDSFLSLETWYKGPQLLESVSFIVSLRPGYDEKVLSNRVFYYQNKYNTNVSVIKDLMLNISSTQVRDGIKNNDDISKLLEPEVERYIKENELYI